MKLSYIKVSNSLFFGINLTHKSSTPSSAVPAKSARTLNSDTVIFPRISLARNWIFFLLKRRNKRKKKAKWSVEILSRKAEFKETKLTKTPPSSEKVTIRISRVIGRHPRQWFKGFFCASQIYFPPRPRKKRKSGRQNDDDDKSIPPSSWQLPAPADPVATVDRRLLGAAAQGSQTVSCSAERLHPSRTALGRRWVSVIGTLRDFPVSREWVKWILWVSSIALIASPGAGRRKLQPRSRKAFSILFPSINK